MGIKIGLLALCFLWAVGECTQQDLDVHLISLTANSNGTAAIAVTGQHRSKSAIYPFTTSTLQVSPACLDNGRSTRCQRLPTISSGQAHVVLALLQDAVGLMQLHYNGTELLKVGDATLSITSEFSIDHCVPLGIINFDGRRIVVCLEALQTLRSCDINIAHANISRSTLSHCRQLYTFINSIPNDGYRSISNFAYYNDRSQVFFTIFGGVYGIRFDRGTVNPYSPLGDDSCDRLQYANNHILYAYCASGLAKVYDTDEESARNATPFVPFACPLSAISNRMDASFHVQQTDQETLVRFGRMEYRTTGLNFTNAECYNARTLFLQDAIEGTKVLNQGSFHVISNSSRDEHLMVFDGPLLAVFRSDPLEIVLYDPTFQPILELSQTTVIAVGVVANSRAQPPTSSQLLPTISPTSTSIAMALSSTAELPTVVPTTLIASYSPTPVPTMLPPTSPPEIGPPIVESNPNASNDLGVAVGSVSAAVVITGIVISVVICCWKQKQKGSQNFIERSMTEGSSLSDMESVSSDRRDETTFQSVPTASDLGCQSDTCTAVTPHDVSDSRGGSDEMVPGKKTLVPAKQISPGVLLDTYNKRTHTEDERNDFGTKVQEMRHSNH